MASRSGSAAAEAKGKNKLNENSAVADEVVDSMMGRLNILADESEVVDMSDDEDTPVTTPVKWPLIGKVRADIPIDKPMRRWVTTTKNKTECRFDLQYEKLPFYCFSCGLIGHGELECSDPAYRDDRGKLPFDRELRAPEDRRRKLQSFSQAAATSSWNSDLRDRGTGSKNYPGSATSRTSKESGDKGGLKPGEQEATSPAAKTPAATGTKGTLVANIAKNLFAGTTEDSHSSLKNFLLKKRKPSAGLNTEETNDLLLTLGNDSPDLSQAMVVCEKDIPTNNVNLGDMTGTSSEQAKKLKSGSSKFENVKVAAANVVQPRRDQ
ncbi:hypothetical protein ACQ4PT_059657 [Festuca glaucescens]